MILRKREKFDKPKPEGILPEKQQLKTINITDSTLVIDRWVNRGLFISTLVALFFTARSLEIAKKTFDATQQQFAVSNEPFLQIDSIRLLPIGRADEPVIFNIYFKNLRSAPVQVINFKARDRLSPDTAGMGIFDTARIEDTPESHEGVYITNESPYKLRLRSFETYDQLNCFFNKICYLYWHIQVIYTDITTGKRRYYRTIGRIAKTVSPQSTDLLHEFAFNKNDWLPQTASQPTD